MNHGVTWVRRKGSDFAARRHAWLIPWRGSHRDVGFVARVEHAGGVGDGRPLALQAASFGGLFEFLAVVEQEVAQAAVGAQLRDDVELHCGNRGVAMSWISGVPV